MPSGLQIKLVSNEDNFNYIIIHPIQSLMLHRPPSFSLCAQSFQKFAFSLLLGHLHSLQTVQTARYLPNLKNWKLMQQFSQNSFLRGPTSAFVGHNSTYGQTFAFFFLPIIAYVAIFKILRYNQRIKSANSWKDCILTLCKFVYNHNSSFHIFTALLYIWLLLIYGSFFPLSLCSQALLLPTVKTGKCLVFNF